MRDDEDLGMRVECFGFRDLGLEASGFGKKASGFRVANFVVGV